MPKWAKTGALSIGRSSHTATRLANGKVLVAGGGGRDTAILNDAEIYDPAAGRWTLTGSLQVARRGHTATLLPNGSVLVTGGFPGGQKPAIHDAELFDPATGRWRRTGSLRDARSLHTATLLKSGLVLIAGGQSDQDFPDRIPSAELYDPATGKFNATGSLTLDNGREAHTATLLANGMVLVAGGRTFGPFMADGAEVYDPNNGTWAATSAPNAVRVDHAATLLLNGRWLVVGGVKSNGVGDELDSAELFNPINRTFAKTGSLTTARNSHTATTLPDGMVLVAGGFKDIVTPNISHRSTLKSAELYNPSQKTWSTTVNMHEVRGEHSATLLGDGAILVAGGLIERDAGFKFTNGAELFTL